MIDLNIGEWDGSEWRVSKERVGGPWRWPATYRVTYHPSHSHLLAILLITEIFLQLEVFRPRGIL